jgi:hypothetical protein
VYLRRASVALRWHVAANGCPLEPGRFGLPDGVRLRDYEVLLGNPMRFTMKNINDFDF